jgi:hypothetical protein
VCGAAFCRTCKRRKERNQWELTLSRRALSARFQTLAFAEPPVLAYTHTTSDTRDSAGTQADVHYYIRHKQTVKAHKLVYTIRLPNGFRGNSSAAGASPAGPIYLETRH